MAVRSKSELIWARGALGAARAQIRAHFGSVGCKARRRRGAPPTSPRRRRSRRVQEANRGGRATSGGRDWPRALGGAPGGSVRRRRLSFLGWSKVGTDSYAKICQRAGPALPLATQRERGRQGKRGW